MKTILKIAVGICLFSVLVIPAMAREQLRFDTIPATISPEAQKELAAIYDAKAYARVFPDANDLEGWRKTHAGG